MKTKALDIIISHTFIVVFNVLWFATVEIQSTTRWVCYSLIHISYLLLWASVCFIPKTRSGFVHGYPRIAVANSYFLLTLITSTVTAAINPNSALWSIIPAGIYLTIYAVLLKAEEYSNASDINDQVQLNFIRHCAEQLQETMHQITNAKQRKQVEQVYDAIRNAQVQSVPQAATVESMIISKAGEIHAAVGDIGKRQSAIEETLALIRQRDSLIRRSQQQKILL